MKRIRYYTGVWSNGKKTIDLDNLNSKYEMKSIDAAVYRSFEASVVVYARESGTIVEKCTYDVLDDYFLDTGPLFHKETRYRILGKNFKKIKDKGIIDEEYKEFLKKQRG